MAKVRLDVDTNIEQASKEMREFGSVIDTESAKYAELVKKYDQPAIDELISKHQRLASAVLATNGPRQAAIVQQRELAKSYKKLIAEGLDPAGDELVSLREEYERVTHTVNELVDAEREAAKEVSDARKRAAQEMAAYRENEIRSAEIAQANQQRETEEIELANQQREESHRRVAEVAQKGSLAIIAAVSAITVALVKNSLAVAENGAEYARQSRMIGVTAEEYQELESSFVKMGGTQDRFADAMADMTEKLGDARLGAGSLNAHLKETNPVLLEQLKNTTSTMDAFNLLTEEMANTTNEQDRMILATELFADAGKDMIAMTSLGADGIQKLREEAREYGIMTNQSVREAEQFVQSQKDLSAAIGGLKNRFGADLIPYLNIAVETATEFIGSLSAQDLDDISDSITFIAESFAYVGVAINSVVGIAMAVGDVMRSIPDAIGHFASMSIVHINEFLIKASNMINNSDVVQAVAKMFGFEIPEIDTTQFENNIVTAQYAVDEFAYSIDQAVETAANRITDMDALNDRLLDFTKNGSDAANTASNLNSSLGGGNASNVNADVIERQREAFDLIQQLREDDLVRGMSVEEERTFLINQEYEKRKELLISVYGEETAELESLRANRDEALKPEGDAGEKSTAIERMRANLRTLTDLEAEANAERVAEFESFYAMRLEQEEVQGDLRFDALQSEYARILELDDLTNEQRVAAEIALNAALAELGEERTEQQKTEAEARFSIIENMVTGLGGMFGDLAAIQKNIGKEGRALLVIEKGLAIAEIGINTQRAVALALASAPPPVNAINATIVGAAGLASAVKVATTPIPSAETGVTEFIAPQSPNGRVDGTNLRVNDDELVTVTPRNDEGGSRTLTVNLVLDREVVQTIVQDGFDGGEYTISSDNIRQVA